MTTKALSQKMSKTLQQACDAAIQALGQAAPQGCFRPAQDGSAQVLTRAGWARVSASPGIGHNNLFVRFSTPCLAVLLGLSCNENSGKWNHFLPTSAPLAAQDAQRLFSSLWPRGEHEMAEAEFFAAVQDELDAEDRRAWDAFARKDEERRDGQKPAVRLPVRRACGARSDDPTTSHFFCPSCGTNYREKEATRFMAAAGRLMG